MIKELKKITWTKPSELIKNFIIVVCFSTILTTMIYLIDLFVVWVQNMILSLF